MDFKRLFRRHGHCDLGAVDHLTDIADTLGALRTGLAMIEDRLDRGRTGIDGVAGVTFADSVTITDVHGKLRLDDNANASQITQPRFNCKSFAPLT